MKKGFWIQVLAAAAIVLGVGAAVAFSETMTVHVENRHGQEVTVDVDGAVETVTLDDLADGEERTFEVGDRTLTVKRVGDTLELVGDDAHGGETRRTVWVGRGEPDHEGEAHKVVVVTRGEGDGEDVSSYVYRVGEGDAGIGLDRLMEHLDSIGLKGLEELDIDVDPGVMVWHGSAGGHAPLVVTSEATSEGYVRYRCEETGSELLVKKKDAVLDSYVCPATGCLMTKMDEPRIHRIFISTDVADEDIPE